MRWLKLTEQRQPERDDGHWPLSIEELSIAAEKQGLDREETYLYWSNEYPTEEPR